MHKLFITLLLVSALSIESNESLNALVIDVRTHQEYQASNIEGSINIEWQNILDVSDVVATKNDKIFLPNSDFDPKRRVPCIKRLKNELNWAPKIKLDFGLKQTLDYYKNLI